MPKRVTDKIKKKVKKRANGYCEYCLSSSGFSSDFFPIDHIIPQSKGGSSLLNNLAMSCSYCNGHKHAKLEHIDPITNKKVRLFHPRKDYWLDHFQWNDDETLIIGLSPIGRATVELLNVNRKSNINLRELLVVFGLHPPKKYPKD